jgi:adenylyltransferase/sulfurtransferase
VAELTPRQAYEALIHFLKAARRRSHSSDVNALLDRLQFLGDDLPVDPALWEAWIAGVRAVGQPLTEARAFTAAARFLTGYAEGDPGPALAELIAGMRQESNGTPANPALWQEWRIAVQRARRPHERAEATANPPPPPADTPPPATPPAPPVSALTPPEPENPDTPFDSPDRYSRQAILPGIGAAGQERIRAGRVAILGLGALGSALAETLTRAGVGTLRLADRDVLEAHNLQRQSLYAEADVAAALPKAVAAAARLTAINRQVAVEAQVADVTAETVEAFIGGMDVVLDGSDNFAARYLLNDACLRLGLPWIYNGVLGTSGLSLTVRPGLTACLRCLYPDPPPPGSTPTCETAGVFGPAVQTVAAVAAAATLQLLVGADPPRGLLAVDLWDGTFERIGSAERDPACPACGAGRYDFLQGGALAARHPAQLCGRATVQVRLDGGLTLPTLAARLTAAGLGQVHANAHLIRLRVPPHELTLFPDGRVLVKGTEDPTEARSLVARYIGF